MAAERFSLRRWGRDFNLIVRGTMMIMGMKMTMNRKMKLKRKMKMNEQS
jgi:hypothetical protein